MEEKPFISPFSLRRHEWKVEWRVQSERPVNRDMQRFTEKEERVMHDLSVFQVITHKQLKKHYRLREKQIQNMLRKRLLVQHKLIKNGKVWYIYTLELIVGYKRDFIVNNYWLGYDEKDLLKQLVLVDFYFEMKNRLKVEIDLNPATLPFQAVFVMNDKAYEVYINKGDINDLVTTLSYKMKKEYRLFIVTEQLAYLKLLSVNLGNEQVLYRVVTELGLYNQTANQFFISEIF